MSMPKLTECYIAVPLSGPQFSEPAQPRLQARSQLFSWSAAASALQAQAVLVTACSSLPSETGEGERQRVTVSITDPIH